MAKQNNISSYSDRIFLSLLIHTLSHGTFYSDRHLITIPLKTIVIAFKSERCFCIIILLLWYFNLRVTVCFSAKTQMAQYRSNKSHLNGFIGVVPSYLSKIPFVFTLTCPLVLYHYTGWFKNNYPLSISVLILIYGSYSRNEYLIQFERD